MSVKHYSLWLPEHRLGEIQKKMESITRKAEKLGFPVPELEVTDNVEVETVPHFHNHRDGAQPDIYAYILKKRECIFKGEVPVFEGWTFLAAIDHQADAKEEGRYINLVRNSPYQPKEDTFALLKELETLKSCPPDCEHCELPRNRKTTYLLRHQESGELKRVGATCIDDFLGESSLESAMAMFDINAIFSRDYDAEFEDECRGGKFRSIGTQLRVFLAAASYLTDEHGFVSRKNDNLDGMPTAESVSYYLLKRGKNEVVDRIVTDFCEKNDNAYLAKADKVIEWIKRQDPSNNTFMTNAQSIAELGLVDIMNNMQTGIAASLSHVYNNAMLMEHSEDRKNEHFGEEKKRGQLKLTVVRIKDDPAAMYPFVRFTMHDDHGRTFQWKAAHSSAPNLSVGKVYTMTGTVAGHDEYKGTKITKINRCSDILECDPETPEPDFSVKPKKKRPKTEETVEPGV